MIKAQSHPRLTALLAGLLAMILAAGVALRWPERGGEDHASAGSGEDEHLEEPIGPPRDAGSTPLGTASTSVIREAPAEAATGNLDELSLLELLDRLGDRARAGDPLAACKLAAAMNSCRFNRLVRNTIRPPPPENASEAELEQYVEFHARFQEQQARAAERCAGADEAILSEGVHFTARAALAGHVDSLLRFIAAPARHSSEFVRDPRLAELYRTQLWPVLQHAFAAGQDELTFAVLSDLLGPIDSPLRAVVPEPYRDPQALTALLSLTMDESELRRLRGPDLDPPSPVAIETARRWVDELFKGRTPQLSAEMRQQARRTTPHSASGCDSDAAWLPR
jgi:hypothetical protein